MGAESPIFRALSPTDAQGLQQQLQKLMDRILEERQKKILDEFSLDNSASALNRLISRVQQTNRDLHSQLTETIEKAGKDAQEFQTQVREALASLQTKKTEAAKSTLQGKEFEAALGEVLAVEAEALGDLHQATGALVGAVERSKVGDYVTELGPDHAAAGVRIVWEAKSSGSYNIQSAREELDLAKRNRKAQLGVFVFDGRTASAPATPFQRIGTDLFICWSPDDRITDVYIKAALSVARALALRENSQKSETTEAIDKIENATNIIFKQIDVLDDIKRKASTVKSHGEAIESKAGRMLEILTEQIQLVNERIAALKTNA
jgi:DNA repair exonuclease SbcCD ATPase subunit